MDRIARHRVLSVLAFVKKYRYCEVFIASSSAEFGAKVSDARSFLSDHSDALEGITQLWSL